LNPSEKYESQLGLFFPTEWKVIKVMIETTNQSHVYMGQQSIPKKSELASLFVAPGLPIYGDFPSQFYPLVN